MNNKVIFLLDLNYTLVENSKDIKHIRPYDKKIKQETYRDWLIDLIKDYYVILITARPDKHKKETLLSFDEKIPNWRADEMYFQEEDDSPPIAKEKLLKKYIFPKHGQDANYFGIESNPATRGMYKKYNIPAISVSQNDGLDFKEELKIISEFNKSESTLPLHEFMFFNNLDSDKKAFYKEFFDFLKENGFSYKASLDNFNYFFNIDNKEISILKLSRDKNQIIESMFRGFKKIYNGKEILKTCVNEVLKIENASKYGYGFKIKIDDNFDEEDFNILKKALIDFKNNCLENRLL